MKYMFNDCPFKTVMFPFASYNTFPHGTQWCASDSNCFQPLPGLLCHFLFFTCCFPRSPTQTLQKKQKTNSSRSRSHHLSSPPSEPHQSLGGDPERAELQAEYAKELVPSTAQEALGLQLLEGGNRDMIGTLVRLLRMGFLF